MVVFISARPLRSPSAVKHCSIQASTGGKSSELGSLHDTVFPVTQCLGSNTDRAAGSITSELPFVAISTPLAAALKESSTQCWHLSCLAAEKPDPVVLDNTPTPHLAVTLCHCTKGVFSYLKIAVLGIKANKQKSHELSQEKPEALLRTHKVRLPPRAGGGGRGTMLLRQLWTKSRTARVESAQLVPGLSEHHRQVGLDKHSFAVQFVLAVAKSKPGLTEKFVLFFFFFVNEISERTEQSHGRGVNGSLVTTFPQIAENTGTVNNKYFIKSSYILCFLSAIVCNWQTSSTRSLKYYTSAILCCLTNTAKDL